MAFFFNVEGIDGSGKTSVLEAIMAWYRQQDEPLQLSLEPGGPPIAQAIREVILADYPTDDFSGITEALLYSASRHQNFKNIILPALDAGVDVLTSRFADSTRAYQGYGRGVSLDIIDQLEAIASLRLKPTLTFVLDVEPSVGLARVYNARNIDRLESSPLDFFVRCRNGFLETARTNPARYHIVDAGQPLETVTAEVIGHIAALKGKTP